jgi:AcrR family transcriptional regulator
VSQAQTGSADGIRGRFRSHVRDEVKRVALEQLAAGGPQALSINAIAKELGVSGPALYRYFASRDELLTDLIADAYHDFAAAIALAGGRHREPTQRLRAAVHAYRAWALAQPHRYRLLFAAPLPGYDAHSDRLVTAAQQAMNVLLDVLAAAGPGEQTSAQRPGRLDRQLQRWARDRGLSDIDPTLARRAIVIWTRLHGLVSLDIEGNFAAMSLDPTLLIDDTITAIQPP